MNAIITVIGVDMVGIIAKVSVALSERKVNILSISQTILDEYFTMMMRVDLSKLDVGRATLAADLEKVGEEMGVRINLINEEVLKAMHRI